MTKQKLTSTLMVALLSLIVGGAAMSGAVAASDDTTVIEGVNNSSITSADNFNVTYDVSELNSSNTLVQNHDSANSTASVDVDIGSNTVSQSFNYSGEEEITVDYSTAAGYPSSLSGDVNVTADQSVETVSVDGDQIHPSSLFGGGAGGGSNSILLLLLVAGGGVYLLRDD